MSIPTRHTLAAYGALGFPYAAAFIALQVVVPTWYAENTALSLSVVGLVMLVARLMDTVTDPVVGWLSDRSRARIGRRKVFVVCAAPFVAVAVWRLFMPSADAGGAYLLFWTVAVYIAGTVALVPMSAWAAEFNRGLRSSHCSPRKIRSGSCWSVFCSTLWATRFLPVYFCCTSLMCCSAKRKSVFCCLCISWQPRYRCRSGWPWRGASASTRPGY